MGQVPIAWENIAVGQKGDYRNNSGDSDSEKWIKNLFSDRFYRLSQAWDVKNLF